jgi:hypothetical protein
MTLKPDDITYNRPHQHKLTDNTPSSLLSVYLALEALPVSSMIAKPINPLTRELSGYSMLPGFEHLQGTDGSAA